MKNIKINFSINKLKKIKVLYKKKLKFNKYKILILLKTKLKTKFLKKNLIKYFFSLKILKNINKIFFFIIYNFDLFFFNKEKINKYIKNFSQIYSNIILIKYNNKIYKPNKRMLLKENFFKNFFFLILLNKIINKFLLIILNFKKRLFI